MAFEISVISVGAVLILLLLMALIFTPDQRGKSEKDYVNQNNSGIYLHAVQFCLVNSPSLNYSASSLSKPSCASTAAESLSVSLLLLISHPPWTPKPLIHWQHEGTDA